MSLEQLKERAARMNREREEKTAQDLEKRNSVIRETEEKKGCKGSIIATSAIISGLALVGIALVSLKKKED